MLRKILFLNIIYYSQESLLLFFKEYIQVAFNIWPKLAIKSSNKETFLKSRVKERSCQVLLPNWGWMQGNKLKVHQAFQINFPSLLVRQRIPRESWEVKCKVKEKKRKLLKWQSASKCLSSTKTKRNLTKRFMWKLFPL